MNSRTRRTHLSRRELTKAVVGGATALFGVKALAAPESGRPSMPCGVASGDVSADGAVVWSKTDRPARMVVEYATTDTFRDARKIVGPAAVDASDHTARVILGDLPPGQTIVYRVSFQDLGSPKIHSEPVTGRFRTPPREKRDVMFTWGGDVAGQGYGINPEWGGYRLYEAMRKLQPDFFIHSGDHIYADNPLKAELKLDDGSIWKNVVTEPKSKVAETLAEFRGNFAYNFLDGHFLRF